MRFLSLVLVFLVQAISYSATWVQRGNDFDGEAAGDRLRKTAINADGSIIAVGAPYNSNVANQAGHIKVFEWDGINWNQVGEDIEGTNEGEYLGDRFTINSTGDIIAIGLPHSNDLYGLVRVYKWNGNIWAQLGDDINGVARDFFGVGLSMSSDGLTIAVGAPWHNQNAGLVQIFQWNGNDWVQLGGNIEGIVENVYLGGSLSISGDGMRVGMQLPRKNDSAGAVKVFELNGGSWSQLGNDLEGFSPYDGFGGSISLNYNGTIIGIGARGYDKWDQETSALIENVGLVQIYQWNGSTWDQLGNDLLGLSEDDAFGKDLSINSGGDVVAIGSDLYYSHDGIGSVKVYQWNGNFWIQRGDEILGEYIWDYNGNGISLSAAGDIVAMAAVGNESKGWQTGHARVFSLSDVDFDGDGVADYFDAFPSNPLEQLDSDNDGIGDNSDLYLGYDDVVISSFLSENNYLKLDEISDLRSGSTMIEVSNNQATIQIQLEESSDLEAWTETGNPATITVPADTDTKFFRFKMAD